MSPVAPRAAQPAQAGHAPTGPPHYLGVSDLSPEAILDVLDHAQQLKGGQVPGSYRPLDNKTAALVFQKPSLRTRVSFEVAILQLGGTAVSGPG